MANEVKPGSEPPGPSDDADAPVAVVKSAPAASTSPPVGRGHGRVHRDLTTGSIPKNLFHQAWPQALEGVFLVADQITDLIWAGRLPGDFRSVASIGVVQQWHILTLTARTGLDVSTRAMVARAVGARDIALANHIVLQALTLTFFYSVIVLVMGVLLTDVLLQIIGLSAELRAEASTYMRFQFASTAFVSYRLITASALQAAGDPFTSFRSTATARVIHMSLSPCLLFGWGFFPEMGLPGAAAANAIGNATASMMNFYALFRGNSRLRLTFDGFRMDVPIMMRMLRLGLPGTVVGIERSVSQMLLLRMVTPFGDVAVAAFAITRRMEIVSSLGHSGVGQATGVMVGQNLGAGHPERSRQAVKWGVTYAAIAGTLVCIVFTLFPDVFLSLFTGNQEVVDLGARWLQWQAISFLLLGTSSVFQMSYNTAGDTMPSMVITMLSVWLVELPVSWYLLNHTDVGVVGIAYAGIAAMALRLSCYGSYFFTDRWLRAKVL